VGSRVHLLRKHVAQVIDPLHVFRVLRVELLIAERLAVVQGLDVALHVLRERASTRRERAGASRNIARDRDPALVLLAPDVALGVYGARDRAVVRGAHDSAMSPYRARTLSHRSLNSCPSAVRPT